MNVEKLKQVEQWLLAGAPERTFNMNKLVEVPEGQKENWCGTACCIAGYVYQQEVPFNQNQHNKDFTGWDVVENTAAEALGLDGMVANRLFYPSNSEGFSYTGSWDKIKPQEAAQAVRNVIEQGEPLWETILDFDGAY